MLGVLLDFEQTETQHHYLEGPKRAQCCGGVDGHCQTRCVEHYLGVSFEGPCGTGCAFSFPLL